VDRPVGSCLFAAWGFHRKNPAGCPIYLLVFNNAAPLPERIADDVVPTDYERYTFRILN
jgi:hypothetical protein